MRFLHLLLISRSVGRKFAFEDKDVFFNLKYFISLKKYVYKVFFYFGKCLKQLNVD